MKITKLSMHDIDPSSFNPPSRTTESAIRGLREEIAKIGMRAPIHVIPKAGRYVLVDGHRRRVAAEELGWRSIDGVVHQPEDNPVELWASLNSKTRSVSAYEWMTAWYLSGQKMVVPPAPRGHINQCQKVFGESGFSFLIEHKASPTVAQTALQLTNKLKEKDVCTPHARSVGMWIVRHRLAKEVQMLLKMKDDKKTLEKLRTRYQKDQPFNAVELATVNVK